jgi:uncharacterized protein YndB with AHSA1/START domain
MLKLLKWVLGIFVGLCVLLLAGGLLLPSGFKVVRSAGIAAPPDAVYALVADPRAWARWGVWTQRDPRMQISYSGPPTGAGAVWEWKSVSEGDGRMTFTAAEPSTRVAFDLFFPDFGSTSKGEIAFTPDGGGTRVVWTMNGDMGANPIYRWMGLFMDKMVGPDFDAGLANLKRLAEKR